MSKYITAGAALKSSIILGQPLSCLRSTQGYENQIESQTVMSFACTLAELELSHEQLRDTHMSTMVATAEITCMYGLLIYIYIHICTL